MMMKKGLSLLLTALFGFSMIACTQEETTTTETITETTTFAQVSALSETTLNAPEYVRWIGRTYYDESAKKMDFSYTGTGFTVTFYGTSLTITINATNTGSTYLRPYFTMSLDDEVPPLGTTFYLTQPTTELTLVEGLEVGVHTVTFLKRSEPIDSETSISAIETDGFFQNPTVASEMKFLIIGASGISGHGNLGSSGQARTTANSDSLRAFGYLTAAAFGGDFQFVSASGWGLVWGYNESNANGTISIMDAFEKVGIDDSENLMEPDYDLNQFVPDFVIVNIGGNDFSSYVLDLEGTAQIEARAIFRAAVTEFCSDLHELYPNTYIIWTHTGSQNGTEAAAAIGDLDPRHDFTRVVEILQVGENGYPVGADGHAGLLTHEKNAEILVAVIQEILDQE